MGKLTRGFLMSRQADVYDDGPTAAQKEGFFKTLASQLHPSVKEALVKANISRAAYERLMRDDVEFSGRVRAWEASILDRIEERAVQAAMDGDTGMIRLVLQAKRPEVYGRGAKDSGEAGIETPEDLQNLTDEQFAAMCEKYGVTQQ